MRFGPGQFLGQRRSRQRLPGLDLADMRPTVPKRDVRMHTHEDAHVLVLHAGAYLSSAEGMPSVCVEPAVVLNPPGTHHRDCFESLDDARFLTLSFDAARWRQWSDAMSLPQRACRLPGASLVAGYRIWRELLDWDDASSLAVEAEIADGLLPYAHRDAAVRDAHGPAWLRRACDRLRDEAGEVPDIATLAREADLHPVYFARVFRRVHGCSPGEYLRRCRIDAAIAGLCAGLLPLAEVALRAGYADQSHMTHALRRAVGMSPRAVRRLGRLEVADLQDRSACLRQAVEHSARSDAS
jgi:AraC family transcriptional regulator